MEDISTTKRDLNSSSDGDSGMGEPGPDVLDECGRRLARLADRVHHFLDLQCRTIEEICQNVRQQAEEQSAWEHMARELRQQEALWEQSKQQQAERIADELKFLSAAWDRIEAERRTLLMNDGIVAAALPPVISTAASPPATEELPGPPAAINLFDMPSTVSGRSAALQFQQIKREIRQHARRSPS